VSLIRTVLSDTAWSIAFASSLFVMRIGIVVQFTRWWMASA